MTKLIQQPPSDLKNQSWQGPEEIVVRPEPERNGGTLFKNKPPHDG